jgi:hypothetical protein
MSQRDHCAPNAHLSEARLLTAAKPSKLMTTWYCDCPRCQEIRAKLPELTARKFKIIEPPRPVRAIMAIEGEEGLLTTGDIELPRVGKVIIVEAAPGVDPGLIRESTTGPARLK